MFETRELISIGSSKLALFSWKLRQSTPATMSKQHCRMLQVERFFRQSRNKLDMFSLFRLCRKDEISRKTRSTLFPKRQQCRRNVRFCRSNIRLCWTNRSTCSIRQCCFDIVAGVDRALGLMTKLSTEQCKFLSNQPLAKWRAVYPFRHLSFRCKHCTDRPFLRCRKYLTDSLVFVDVIWPNDKLMIMMKMMMMMMATLQRRLIIPPEM